MYICVDSCSTFISDSFITVSIHNLVIIATYVVPSCLFIIDFQNKGELRSFVKFLPARDQKFNAYKFIA